MLRRKVHVGVSEIVAGPVDEEKNSSCSGDDETRPTRSRGEGPVPTKINDRRNVADYYGFEEIAFRLTRERRPPQRLVDYVVRSGRS